jgi:hypothetical protein
VHGGSQLKETGSAASRSKIIARTLPNAIVAVVEELGDAHVHTVAAAYRSADTYTVRAAAALRQAVPGGHRRRPTTSAVSSW